ncbi:zinc finger MYM-type protein 1-like protein [Tanacetum coccineum]
MRTEDLIDVAVNVGPADDDHLVTVNGNSSTATATATATAATTCNQQRWPFLFSLMSLLHAGGGDPVLQPTPQPISQPIPGPFTPINIKLDGLLWDPSDRPIIYNYDPNIVEEIRRMYWDRGPCQPKGHKNHGAGDAFTVHGFDSWSKKTSLKDHVGELNSFHNKALQKCENLMKKKQSISLAFNKQTEQEMGDYRILLCFLELYHLLANKNEETRMAVARVPLNCNLTSPKIHKPICEYFAKEVLDSILEDIGDNVFSLLVDESIVVSKKEQMEMVFQYLNRHGVVQERFVGVIKVLKYVKKEALDGRNRNQATVLKMDEICVAKRNRVAGIKNRLFFEIDIFNTVLDMEIQEFGDGFGEISADLLINMSALSPYRFSLRRELDLYYETVIHDTDFMELAGIVELATLMVTLKNHISFPLIFKLLKLSLLLHVAIATVEKCFSAMKLIKTNLRSRMGENYMNDALICNIEKELFAKITNEDVMKRF